MGQFVFKKNHSGHSGKDELNGGQIKSVIQEGRDEC